MLCIETLIAKAITSRKLLVTFERCVREHSAATARGEQGRRLKKLVDVEYQVLQRTLSTLSSGFHDPSRSVDIDTSPIDLFVIDYSSVEIRAVISTVDIIIEVLEMEQRFGGYAAVSQGDSGEMNFHQSA